jgi:predicted kinase
METKLFEFAVKYGFWKGGPYLHICEPNWEFIESIEDFKKLSDVPQSKKWHAEGDALTHTKMVVCEMVKLINSEPYSRFSRQYKFILLFVALFHDIGKGKCLIEDGKCLSQGHNLFSERLTRTLLWDIGYENREMICELVFQHDLHCVALEMKERRLKSHLSKMSEWLRYNIDLLFLVFRADVNGSISNEPRLLGDIEKRIINCLKQNDFTVYIMCGLPGAGKDTYIKNNLSELPMVSRDGEKGRGTDEEEKSVTIQENKQILNYCENRESFVVNNTHLKLKYRKQLIDSISKYGPKIIIVYVEAETLDLNLSRRTGSRWEYVIKEMLASIEIPSENEANELIIITT